MNLHYAIQSPCKKEWTELDNIGQCSVKYCSDCQKKVFDITDMDHLDIESLYEQNEGTLCVRMPANKKPLIGDAVKQRKTYKKRVQWGLVSLALLIGGPIVAQKVSHKQYTYQQVETKSSTIILSGKILRPKGHKWKKLDRVFIQINNGSSLELVEAKWVNTKHGFIVELEKEMLGAYFNIYFEHDKFAPLSIKNIPAKNTHLSIRMQKTQTTFVMGRFF